MRRKIDTNDLQLGMYVAELDRPWIETPFLFQGFVVTSKGDINELERCCQYVYIDEERSNYVKEKPLSSQVSMRDSGKQSKKNFVKPTPLHSVEEEISAARSVREIAEKQVSDLMQQVRSGKAIDVQQAQAVVGDIVHSLERSPDAMVLLGSIKSHEREAEAHAINNSILSITLGRYMQFSSDMVAELGLAALLHDVGEVKIPVELLRDGTKNPQQAALVMKHTELGAEILASCAGIPKSAVDVALSHHEQVNGKGYPKGLRADQISLFSKIVSIVDTYDSLTRGKGERNISATEAMRYLYLYRDKFFDAGITEAFIKCLGIYPVGSLVELANGEVGIVISVQAGELLHPRLLLVRRSDKRPYEKPKIMNLALFAKDEPEKYSVKQVLAPHAYGVDMRSYLLNEAFV